MDCVDTTPMAGIIIKMGVDEDETAPSYTFGCIRKVNVPKFKRDKTDNTCLSDVTLIKEFCLGFGEPEPLQFTIRHNATDYDELFGMFMNAETRNWLVQFPLTGDEVTPSKWTFDSWIEDLGESEAVAANSEKMDTMVTVFPQHTDFEPAS